MSVYAEILQRALFHIGIQQQQLSVVHPVSIIHSEIILHTLIHLPVGV